MSTVREEGKDKIIFVTKEDHETPSSAELVQDDPDDPYEERGLILPTGEINWNCPCLGGMASGPCGSDFKDAFSCFHYSKEEVKGSDCLEQFRAMQECMQRFPELYPQEDDKVPPEQSSETEASSPDPAKASSPDPAEASSPDPAEASSPDPAEASSPDPAKASSPDPAEASGGSSAPDIEQDLNSMQPNAENSVRS